MGKADAFTINTAESLNSEGSLEGNEAYVAGPSPHCTDLMTSVTMMLAVSVRSRTLCCMTLERIRFWKRVFLWKLTPAETGVAQLGKAASIGIADQGLWGEFQRRIRS
jgi:hypothetical protein